jgi:hypothetical protein
MLPTTRHHDAETRFRDLLENADLAPPDDVEYTPEGLVLKWHGPKLAVVVDFEEGVASLAHVDPI